MVGDGGLSYVSGGVQPGEVLQENTVTNEPHTTTCQKLHMEEEKKSDTSKYMDVWHFMKQSKVGC